MAEPAPPVVIPAEGTTLGWVEKPDTGTPVYAETAQILNVKPPGGTVASVGTSHLKSKHKTYRPGQIPDSGEVTFRVEIDPNNTSHQSIFGKIDTPGLKLLSFQITYNDGLLTPANDTFDGFFTKYEPDTLEDEKNLEADVTIQVSGPVVRTAGSAV